MDAEREFRDRQRAYREQVRTPEMVVFELYEPFYAGGGVTEKEPKRAEAKRLSWDRVEGKLASELNPSATLYDMFESKMSTGERGLAVRLFGFLVPILSFIGIGLAKATQDGSEFGSFKAKLVERGLVQTSEEITVTDVLGFKIKSGQTLFWVRLWGEYYHLNSGCPPT